ncbi:hypothetical protein LOAG_04877 [Loa loa]|uniref:Conserved plasma membrane protein n=1 Tax=Loa loa TaxID=7209 RepID=A0A1I7VYV4_LOALO|nr:hypothetical protein LOAG_04877 [Loa loa]EFO23612.2 hypothetical protein LOAG_04877 [Loa loa]
MGLQWFLLLMFCFLCDWLFTNGDGSLQEINGTELLDQIKKDQMAELVVKGITTATENNTNIMAAVTPRARLQHAASLTAIARVTKVVPLQTSARQVVLASTAQQQLKQERRGFQTSNEFAARSSPLQTLARLDEFDKAENTHFLYYIVVFGAIILCIYVASHNKKKILGFIIEGHRPPNNTRRAPLRYRRLNQYDDNGSVPTNVIY